MNKIKNRCKKSRNKKDKTAFRKAGKEYRKFVRRKMRTFYKKFHNKIRGLKSSNPKDYWNILKSNTKNKILSKISLECMYEHFKKLGDKPDYCQEITIYKTGNREAIKTPYK